MKLSQGDLSSTFELVECLIGFKNTAFEGSDTIAKHTLPELRQWHEKSKPFLRVSSLIPSLDDLIPDTQEVIHQLVDILFSPLKSTLSRADDTWVPNALNFCIEFLLSSFNSLLNKCSAIYRKGTLDQESTQLPLRLLKTNSMIYEQIISACKYSQLSCKQVDENYRAVLDLIAEIATKRIKTAKKSKDESFADEILEMIEEDMVTLRTLGLHVPSLTADAIRSFKYSCSHLLALHCFYSKVFEQASELMHNFLCPKLEEFETMKNEERLPVSYECIKRRCQVLTMLNDNRKILNIRHLFLAFSEKDLVEIVNALHRQEFYRFHSSNGSIILVSPQLGCSEDKLKEFLGYDTERLDLFSNETIFVFDLSAQNIIDVKEWKTPDFEFTEHIGPSVSPLHFKVYCHWLHEWMDIFRDARISVKWESDNVTGCYCFAREKEESFRVHIQDNINLLKAVPVAHFKAKTVTDMWNSAVALWDLVEALFLDCSTEISQGFEDFKLDLCKASIILLRFACVNIRMNYLEPFTWATQILVRFTKLVTGLPRSELESIISPKELSSIYMEFSQKWDAIERAANRQWDACIVQKNEITALQIAACNLELALFSASKFLPDVQPLQNLSGTFLLHFPTPIKPPIFQFIESKNFRLVSTLKRKRFIETFCCYDLNERDFVTVKEIKLVSGAVEVTNKLNLLERYAEISKIKHPNLTHYHSAEIRGENMYVVMEFCPGKSIQSQINEKGRFENEHKLRDICRSILTGLAYLHNRGLAHGDISPGNVLVDQWGYYKFADYGDINRQSKAALSKIDLSYMSHTIPYMAPEVATHSADYDVCKADVWSFGCLLIELVTGDTPWHELEHDYSILYRLVTTRFLPEALMDLPISEEGSAFIKWCLTHEPEKRPSVYDLLLSPYLTLAPHPKKSIRPRI